jgi:hypothetical protein
LSILALVLAIVWLGQVVVSILLRQPADPQKLHAWIPLGLLAYTIYHLLRAACRTPIEPFEWTPAEVEVMGGAPLRRQDVVMYRLMAIAIAAIAKAGCFALVMWPDMPVWLAGFAGMFLALLLVDLIRMAVEITVYGLSRREFLCFRIVVLGLAAIAVGMAVADAVPLPDTTAGELPSSLAIGLRVLNSLMDLRHTFVGTVLVAPFEFLATVILAPQWSMTLLLQLVIALAMVLTFTTGVVGLDQAMERRRVSAQRRIFRELSSRRTESSELAHAAARLPGPATHSLRVPPRWLGWGPLFWRQLRGAVHYRTSLCIAMLVPGLLSCLTLLTPHRGTMMLIQLVGGLIFYSFLLLPTAFKFDFRRDVDRLAVLKALPISPAAVTIGQLAVPVLLCTLFQTMVLLIAMLVRPYQASLLMAAIVLLLPTNVLIFSLENLIFLLYPYRLNQEGLGVFFRSILTFTGKGILFAGALGVALLWAIAARHIISLWADSPNSLAGHIVFMTGLWLLIAGTAIGTTALLVRAYRHFDPSQDTPQG